MEIEENKLLETFEIYNLPKGGRSSLFSKKATMQVIDTAYFEFQRNWKKFIILCIVVICVFFLFVIIGEINIANGFSLPSDSKLFASSQLGNLNIFIYISSMAYGGSIIAGEFEHQTGNLLFPKINRSRLLLGRILGLFLLNSFTIILWYFLIALYIGSHYNWQIPMELGFSLGFAVLFSLTVLSFMISISSWMKSTSGTIIIANFILFFLLGAILIIGMALSTDEQLFNLLYYGYIIANIIQMPEPRYLELITPISPTESLTIRTWLTPSVETAIIGMITHIFIYLLISFIFFQRRQLK